MIGDVLSQALQAAARSYAVPRATYRLQMHAEFTLRDALRIVPYLARLGISHLYLSSLLTARPGSLHGYDVANHAALNPELGTEDDLAQLAQSLHSRNMGLILDVVPNHMWVGEGNAWWMDVLENGPTSRFAEYFSISWRNHPRERLRNKVLLPILDDWYGKVLQAGRIVPFYEAGRFGITIDEARLPLDPRTFKTFLEPVLAALLETNAPDDPRVVELQSIISSIRHLPSREHFDPSNSSEALGEASVIKRRLRELVDQNPEIAAAIEKAMAEIRGVESDPSSFSRLVELLDAQVYRPCFWRVALDEINYRRFFDVNDLAALATERIDVFLAVHLKIFEWMRKGFVSGLRIDHIDGLLKPKEYLDRLQTYAVICEARRQWDSDHGPVSDADWSEIETQLVSRLEADHPVTKRLYVVVEKILGQRETCPDDWACDGTTGYEFLNQVNSLFVDTDSAEPLTRVYREFTGRDFPFDQLSYESKLQVLRSTMASELHVLAHYLDRLAQMEWWSRDFTLNGLRQALEEMIACFPVYRSYIYHEPTHSDRLAVMQAASRARRKAAFLGKEVFEFICNTLLLQTPQASEVSPDYREQQRKFAGKFQQLTSPVMAKGVEDTALYLFNRLVSLNEVGSSPDKFGSSPDDLHGFLQKRADTQRGGLSPLSTHDTKRSADVRARINVLSEIPEEWGRRLQDWATLNRSLKTETDDGVLAPDENDEYLIYQTLVGAWPDEKQEPSKERTKFTERMQAYLQKAIHEAKAHSSWISPDAKYDSAVSKFIQSILDEGTSGPFLASLNDFLRQIHPYGKINSLAQTLIQCTAPGVPDIYQGSESWDYSLVDPDNRRPVDYPIREQALKNFEAVKNDDTNNLFEQSQEVLQSERAKLFVTNRTLQLRNKLNQLFQKGHYIPLETTGPDARHLFAFMLCHEGNAVLVAVPRLMKKRSRAGQQTDNSKVELNAEVHLPLEWNTMHWKHVFTGAAVLSNEGKLSSHELFKNFPVVLLESHSTAKWSGDSDGSPSSAGD